MNPPLDALVRRAQAGDAAALETLLGALRGPLARQARRLGVAAGDVDDAVQEALLDVARGLAGYRWESGFLGWAYAIGARRGRRHARTRAAQALELTEALETWLATPEDPLEPGERVLVEQAVNLRCALAVASGLSPALRRAYLLGEVLGVSDAVGAEALGIGRAAFRQRLRRARAAVEAELRDALAGTFDGGGTAEAGEELDRLLRLGDLHRASGRPADAAAALRALQQVAPTLAAG